MYGSLSGLFFHSISLFVYVCPYHNVLIIVELKLYYIKFWYLVVEELQPVFLQDCFGYSRSFVFSGAF